MRDHSLNRAIGSLLVYLFYLGALTLSPFDFSSASIAERTWVFGNILLADFLINIFGFVPFGAILYTLTRAGSGNVVLKFGITVGLAAILSFSIETGQLFLLPRIPSLTDILTNTFGGGLGFWAVHYLRQAPWIVRLKSSRRKLVFAGLAFYLGSFIILSLWAATPRKLETWDPSYPFLIGNEYTMDRPWLGKIFVVALYDRVLTIDEIESQFRGGPHFDPEVYLKGAPIALYSFREAGGSRVHDRSAVGPPLDLEIADPEKATWLPMGGLELSGPNVLQSIEGAEKIHHQFTATNTFSVAAWVEPKDALQAGPARIVSFSRNPSLRNFTLGQEKSEIHLRVRNRVAGLNGTRVNLRTVGLRLSPKPTHLVAIYERGTEHLYVDGVLFQKFARQDVLSLVAQTLDFNAASRWQRALLIILLLGPVAVFGVLLKGSQLRN